MESTPIGIKYGPKDAKHPEDTVRLPLHVLKSIQKGIDQYNNDETIYLEEFIERHFTKVK